MAEKKSIFDMFSLSTEKGEKEPESEKEPEEVEREGEPEHDKSHKQNKDSKTAIFDFFKLKSEYKKNADLFKKRKNRATAARPKCVNCNRLVGTNFTIKKDQYAAVCGDKTSPCKLNILITREPIQLYRENLELFRKDIIKEKSEIIKNKLDVIFGYITENAALQKTETLLDDYNTDVMALTDYKENYQRIIMSEEREKDIQKIQNEIEEHIREIQYLCDPSNIHKRGTTAAAAAAAATTTLPLEEIIQLYLHDLFPKIEKIRNLKYPLLEMDKSDYYNANYYRYDFLPEKEFIAIEDTVVKWIVGA